MSGFGWCPMRSHPCPPYSCSCCFFSGVLSRFHDRRFRGGGFAWVRGELPAVVPHKPATRQRKKEREKKEPAPSEKAHGFSRGTAGKDASQGFQRRQQCELCGRISVIAEGHHQGHKCRRAHTSSNIF